jgi:calcineurin-like phosphoesterase family protein/fibronectin type III domain protein
VGWGSRASNVRSVALLLAFFTVAVVIAVAVAVPASAATTTFTPTADARVTEGSPSTNFGTSTALRVDGGTDPDVQSYLRFSVSGLSGTVQSATLRVWATSPTNNGPSVFTTPSTWSENTITWNTKPALQGSGVGKVTNIATSTWAEFDVTSLVTGDGTYDLVLAGTSTDGVDLSSREATNKPQLVVTTQTSTSSSSTPPPTSSPPPTTQVTTVPTSADALVNEANPSTAFGTSTALRVDGGSDPDVQTYLRFGVSGLTDTVQSAKLRLWATSPTNNGPSVFTTADTWNESSITWNNKPPLGGSGVGKVTTIATSTWAEFDVTSLVSGNGTYDFVLAGTSTDGVDFQSREAANDPQLVITTGPPDTEAPSAPTGLTASASAPTIVDLSWKASTDNVGVTNYLVFRNGNQIATIGATTTYTDTTASANTSYTYTVKARDAAGNLSGASNAASVTTPVASTAPTIAVAGDIACSPSDPNYNGGRGTASACRQQYTSDLVVNKGYAAVLPIGDLQYNSGSLSDFQKVYDPTWGRVKSISHPAVGNHEYGQSGASGYFSYFGSLAGPVGKGWYSFDVGSWHLVAINSNCDRVSCTKNSEQESWLRADLAAHPNLCTLVFDHHARWSSGHDGDNTFMQPIWQDLYDANVEMLLSGHSHDYERFAPQDASGKLDNTRGVRQFVIGTGGAFFTGIGSAHANSQVRQNSTFGILKLTLRSTGYDWQFVPEAGKTFTDSGSTACH